MSSWYKNTREKFLLDTTDFIVSCLYEQAASGGWQVEPDQDEEWRRSLDDLRSALSDTELAFVEGVLVEYDFRRRGLRIDFLLIAGGTVYVLEFKRGSVSAADRDQVLNYCVNLVEFHELTQSANLQLFPILVSRSGKHGPLKANVEWHEDWLQICKNVIHTTTTKLKDTLLYLHLNTRPPRVAFTLFEWDNSPFHPSSTIIDATISLYGQHDVSAIKEHAVPKEAIDRCIAAVIEEIDVATEAKRHELIIVSGAPGAGKTLVGLAIAFHKKYREDAVFVTGNAPLVDVLNGSLHRSYVRLRKQGRTKAMGGYTRSGVAFVEKNTDFKIVKAHRFLETVRKKMVPIKTSQPNSTDGRILVFDEAQRTYAENTYVNRRRLEQDEALLITEEMAQRSKSIMVLLLGHNQHINTAEMGARAWLKAARKHGWHYAVSDETLSLEEFSQNNDWVSDPLRIKIQDTHLSHSIRDQRTRNGEIEKWAHFVMTNQPNKAAEVAASLSELSTIFITRSLQTAKNWVRSKQIGEDRCGLIASGQGRRLRSEGIFVDEKPDIVQWMLAPSDDVRSSNMLEQTQNQYQIQGLEIDYAIVCWDADYRRNDGSWACFNINGAGWVRYQSEDEARGNSYRVLLTRSRKGMVLFVPSGDKAGHDLTRDPRMYDNIALYLKSCGAQDLEEG